MNPRLGRAARSAKRLALRAGFEVNRRGAVRRTPEAVLDNVKRLGFQPATVIDVGVAYGTPELYGAFPDSRFLLVDPLEEYAKAYMKERGYVTYDLYGGHLRLLDGALAMMNMAFVREDGRFRRSHDFATEGQARAMYEGWGY